MRKAPNPSVWYIVDVQLLIAIMTIIIGLRSSNGKNNILYNIVRVLSHLSSRENFEIHIFSFGI